MIWLVLAPSVCALTSCSLGISCVRRSRSRAMKGVMPSTINITLDSSPSPKMMNSTGRIASGGISETTVSSGLMLALITGSAPVSRPIARPILAAMATPMPSRFRLLAVSTQKM